MSQCEHGCTRGNCDACLDEELAQLRADLRTYGRHTLECDDEMNDGDIPAGGCTCGWGAVARRLEGGQ